MASVAVAWKGNCHDPRIRYRLLGHLHRLAARSDEYLRLRQPERPRVLDVMNQQRGGGVRARANIEIIDQDIAGTILLSSFVSPEPEALLAEARRAGLTLIDDPEVKAPPLIAIESGRLSGLDFKLFDPRTISRLEAEGNCTALHFTDGTRYLDTRTLRVYEQMLDPTVFLRVHRSHLVRADCIVAMTPCGHGDMKLSLRDGGVVTLSRRYRALLPAGALDG